MASPVVAGTVALMLEAHPLLTPNMVKAIVQYTSQQYAGYNALTQGAGFLNTHGAIALARFFGTAQDGSRFKLPSPNDRSRFGRLDSEYLSQVFGQGGPRVSGALSREAPSEAEPRWSEAQLARPCVIDPIGLRVISVKRTLGGDL